MFQFKIQDNPKINKKSIKADYYYALMDTNNFLLERIKHDCKGLKDIFYDVDYLSQLIAYQATSMLKNNYLAFVLVHEFNVAKLSGLLNEEGNDEVKLLEYIEYTNSAEWQDYFFDKYPLLKTRIENYLNNFVDYFHFFKEVLRKDFVSIQKEFGISSTISHIELFLGDFHKNNKYVLRVDFQEGKSVFFKPRDFKNEQFFENTIQFFNKHGANVQSKIPKSIGGDSYSWIEGLEILNDFQTEDEVSNFFFNQGKLLFVFNLLGTTDIIPDNMIITQNSPGYFDLECVITKPKYKVKGSIRYEFEESVLKTGMLPVWMVNNNFQREILSSTFFRFNSQKIKTKVWQSENNFVYEYKDKIDTFSKNQDKHLPQYGSRYIELNQQYLDRTEEGFAFMYKIVQKQKETFNRFIKDRTKDISPKQRIILHPTAIYSLFQREVNIPEYLQGESNIEEIVKTLVEIGGTDNYEFDNEKVTRSICQQLENLDIPYFYLNINNGHLYDGYDQLISENWGFGPEDYLIEKTEKLSDKDLKLQLEILRKTVQFAFEYYNIEQDSNKFVPAIKLNNKGLEIENSALKSVFLTTALEIGNKLVESAHSYHDSLNWISKTRDPMDGRYQVSLLNYDLYDGLSGMVFLFTYLYKYSGEAKYKEISLKIFRSLGKLIENRSETRFYENLPKGTLNHYPISPYAYPMSYAFLSDHIRSVFGETYIDRKKLEMCFDQILIIIKGTNCYDYLLGLAGTIDFTLNFIRQNDESESLMAKADSVLNTAIEELLKNAKKTENGIFWEFHDEKGIKQLGGFAHGSGGIAYVLLKAAKQLGREDLFSIGQEALKHDRSFYSDSIKGWIDSRDEDGTSDSVAWCHGASGIGLSRILMKPYIQDDALNSEIEISLNKILKAGFHGNQCICHGDLGNLEILKALNSNDPKLNHTIDNYILQLCEHYKKGKSFASGDGGKMELLGLFMGSSGIAYQLIRFYDWENTPSILCLESPNYLNHGLH